MCIKAIIVTFNPTDNIFNLVNSLKKQNVYSIVVDNGSENFDFRDIENDHDTTLIKLHENYGIAKAQNEGVKKAVEMSAEFLFFFDQDSIIDDSFVDDMIHDYEILISKYDNVGALGPRFVDQRQGFYYKAITISENGKRIKLDVEKLENPIHSKLLISSGSLVSQKVFLNTGFMREDYFIDYVDTEWCIRAESKGYKNFISSKGKMVHSIGDNIKNFGFLTIPIHSPFRRYHIIRNNFYMFKESYIPKKFVTHQLIVNCIHQFFLILTMGKMSKQYFIVFLKAIKDGVKYLLR
ncbi:rhamnosyltransferase [Acinetobacter sp. TGL-Y2]|uniref:glycosyltransferase family 2 protein n=1 Tax=Acinetobacter sp. TGL-Y2 TaxID=1407071 RepID=UPI0007A6449C|nr:glycosyltransferase family 2 protein [Acinetobacter sp. TGL-Y2]AMW77519.1 rhamnosyltransferase [Acinetobacter sp. TGL-Y2]